MQARRIEEKEGNSLIKDNTTENSTWMKKQWKWWKNTTFKNLAPEIEEKYT